ncbi:MAG: DUF4852 domain-containing protein [Bacteroidetes bacterium]|jgi:hypothetical protein|nr:DUF4852 domain-containing protein [Bacteroidota bacterium]MBT6686079.1 DUF4852 domain-containing protein [Bacteroidota bacterium]MBT7142028.1 DUF4852 domain-containing protein [Bacteroidota bacterium]MBT7493586.1 DUF4852 domain-containing protein [Bacteroidota bacterium]
MGIRVPSGTLIPDEEGGCLYSILGIIILLGLIVVGIDNCSNQNDSLPNRHKKISNNIDNNLTDIFTTYNNRIVHNQTNSNNQVDEIQPNKSSFHEFEDFNFPDPNGKLNSELSFFIRAKLSNKTSEDIFEDYIINFDYKRSRYKADEFEKKRTTKLWKESFKTEFKKFNFNSSNVLYFDENIKLPEYNFEQQAFVVYPTIRGGYVNEGVIKHSKLIISVSNYSQFTSLKLSPEQAEELLHEINQTNEKRIYIQRVYFRIISSESKLDQWQRIKGEGLIEKIEFIQLTSLKVLHTLYPLKKPVSKSTPKELENKKLFQTSSEEKPNVSYTGHRYVVRSGSVTMRRNSEPDNSSLLKVSSEKQKANSINYSAKNYTYDSKKLKFVIINKPINKNYIYRKHTKVKKSITGDCIISENIHFIIEGFVKGQITLQKNSTLVVYGKLIGNVYNYGGSIYYKKNIQGKVINRQKKY